MDARYLKAITVLPDQDKVCGRTLKAFCIRHRVVLEAINSPFLDIKNDTVIHPYDVMIAVKVMSTYDKTEIVKPLSVMEHYELFRMRYNKRRLIKNAAKVIAAITESISYPKLWNKNCSNKTSDKIPWTLACVANNVRNGCSLEEAWTMPEGEAVWMSISHGIYNGSDVQIVSTDDDAMLDDFDNIINRFKETN